MRRYGLFRIASSRYAVAMPQIIRITQDAELFRLPRLPGGVAGVLVDAGSLIPLLNLRGLLVGSCEGAESAPCQVLVWTECGRVALPAELDGRIVSEHKGRLTGGDTGESAWVSGEFWYQESGYQLLDIEFLAIEMTQGFLADPA